MEQAESLTELEDLLDELEEILDDSELEEDIALLVSSVAAKLTRTGEEVPAMRTFEEVKNMLLERAERWPKQWEAKGRQEGRLEGRQEGLKKGLMEGLQKGLKEGLRKGKLELLKDLASQRFGKLTRAVVERFDRADIDSLDRWSRQLLAAKHLEDVFDDASE